PAPGPVSDELGASSIEQQEHEARHAAALRVGLDDYVLEEEDTALLEDDVTEEVADHEAGLPVLAIIGRPNVGKSTFVNRVLGRREAVVQDDPGVTRDRVSYPAEWAGRHFTIVDTGGWEQDADGLQARVAEQAEIAISMADAIVFLVDANVGV